MVEFPCPHCGQAARVSQVQGDRCPGCGFEFKWFDAGEAQTARDYLEVLTGKKHYLPLPDRQGFIVAHE
jgi:Zn-finger nucleic acid-binding protein